MNHETTIKRIQELVPSVMELKEGCRIIRNGTRENPQNILYKVLENRGLMTGISMHDTSYNKLICYDYTFETLETFRSEDKKENPIENSTILGKPITIAVILLALKSEIEIRAYIVSELLEVWNLSKDNFNDQSEETKTFIGELLATL